MSDYMIDAATKEEWAERAIKAEDTVAYLKSEIIYLRGRIKDLEIELDAGDCETS